jgi:hypothetical protein
VHEKGGLEDGGVYFWRFAVAGSADPEMLEGERMPYIARRYRDRIG